MIYIATHTDFTEYKKEGEYTIMTSKPLQGTYSFPVIEADNDLKPMQFAYAEGYMIHDIYTHIEDNPNEWIGLNHYRRYFDNPTDTITLPQPYLTNMHRQYAGCHNANDLHKVERIIDEYYPEYSTDYTGINEMFICNMFILPKQDFITYHNFVFGVLDIFNQQNNLHTDEDVKKYVERNKEQYNKSIINTTYQSRLQGFLMERIGTIFFLKYRKEHPDVSYLPIKITDNPQRTY